MSVLQTPEVKARYSKNYVGAHADFAELELDDKDPGHAMVQRHNRRKMRPVLVFLDHSGNEVARRTGKLKDKEEALLLDRYVSGRHYLKSDFPEFRAAEGK